MQVKQVKHGDKFIHGGKIYIHSIHGRSSGGKIAVRNITDNCEELLDGRLECELTTKVPELKTSPIIEATTTKCRREFTFMTIFDNLIKWFKEII